MQGFRLANDIKLMFSRKIVLEKLRANLEVHKMIIAEAKTGYLVKAREALEERLARINAGVAVSLSFDIQRPVNHIAAYKAMISMLKAATDDSIGLTIEQQQAFMEDKWDWQRGFLDSNAGYSATASRMIED